MENLSWFYTLLNIIIIIAGFIWNWSRTQATQQAGIRELKASQKSDIDKIGMRLNAFQDKYDLAILNCREKHAEVGGRVLVMEQKNYMTFEDHAPTQETCRKEIFHMIESTDKKVEKFEDTVNEMKFCLHRMDKNIATLLAYNGKGEQ